MEDIIDDELGESCSPVKSRSVTPLPNAENDIALAATSPDDHDPREIACVVLRSAIRFVQGKDGGTLLDIAEDRFHHLNSTGAVVLGRLLSGRTVQTVSMQIANETSSDLNEIRADVKTFLADLCNKRLIEFRERAS